MNILRYLALTATLCACTMTPGTPLTSRHATIFSPAMEKSMAYAVHTPPQWTAAEKLPLLVLLHGASDDETTFDHYQVGQYLDELTSTGELPRVVVVVPNGDLGFWENWHDGSRRYRDWVIDDLLPVVRAEFNTLPCPEQCFVTGMSMGAHGAMRFAYFAPEMFSSVAAISGRIVSREQAQSSQSLKMAIMKLMLPIKRIWGDLDKVSRDGDPYVAWVEKPELRDIRLLLAWGDQEDDSIILSNTQFHQHLKRYARPHQTLVYEGEHAWRDWKSVIAESIRFHLSPPPAGQS